MQRLLVHLQERIMIAREGAGESRVRPVGRNPQMSSSQQPLSGAPCRAVSPDRFSLRATCIRTWVYHINFEYLLIIEQVPAGAGVTNDILVTCQDRKEKEVLNPQQIVA